MGEKSDPRNCFEIWVRAKSQDTELDRRHVDQVMKWAMKNNDGDDLSDEFMQIYHGLSALDRAPNDSSLKQSDKGNLEIEQPITSQQDKGDIDRCWQGLKNFRLEEGHVCTLYMYACIVDYHTIK